MTRTLAALLGAAALLPAGSARAQSLAPDAIYVGGRVLTMDARGSTAEAVAVRGDRIVAVGDRRSVEALAGAGTRIVELRGRVMAPGLYAAHDHFPGAGTLALFHVDLNSPPIGRIQDMDALVAALRERASRLPPGSWVVGRGYDDTLLREGRHPTRADLDRASTDHPIWITHISGHLNVGNSKALELAGITRETPQPKGGVIRMDRRTGEPDGVFEESGGLVGRLVPPLTQEQRLEAMKWAVGEYLSRGVTTTVIAGGGRESLADLQAARRAGLLRLRVVTMTSRGAPGQRSAAEAAGLSTGFGDEWLKLGAIKMVQDGSIQGYTGYLGEPYHKPHGEDAAYRGYPRRPRAELAQMVAEASCAGNQVAIHANGDAAIDDALFALEEAAKACPRADARHRTEHTQMARPDQLRRMRALGVTPSFFVGHVFYWGDRHRDIFMGPERGARISPLRSALDAGLRFTIHDDTPVTPVNPLMLVWDAVNRITRQGKVLGPQERITPLQALRAVTSDAAWQNFEEALKGSIEPGKLADLVILSDDPLAVAPEKIRDIQVLETIVGGASVYRRDAASPRAQDEPTRSSPPPGDAP